MNNPGVGAGAPGAGRKKSKNTGLGKYVFQRQMGEGIGTDSVFR